MIEDHGRILAIHMEAGADKNKGKEGKVEEEGKKVIDRGCQRKRANIIMDNHEPV